MFRKENLMKNIISRLTVLTDYVRQNNKLGWTDANHCAEDFYCGLLNTAFGWKLKNQNELKMDFPAIDLGDPENRICVQVTSTTERSKVQGTLCKFFGNGLNEQYSRLIVLIIGEKPDYRSGFQVEEGFAFDPKADIWDSSVLNEKLSALEVDVLEQVSQYLDKQLNLPTSNLPTLNLPLSGALEKGHFVGREAEEYAKDPNTLEFTMDYEYLPDNVIHRLMVEMRNDLDLANVWRTGARFFQAGTALSAVVKSEGNLLRIFVRSDNPMHLPNTYLHIIKGNIDRINEDMKLQAPFCEVIYKDGDVREAFDYEDLIAALKDGDTAYRSKKLRRKIPIHDILNPSGRMAEMALNKLRDDIITACMQLQGNRMYWDTEEDNRNTAIRDALLNMGYLVNDQTLQGVGGGKEERAGELDLEIRQEAKIPWTICEALNISGKENSVWEPHLKKLLDNYNPSGMNYLFLLTYVESDRDTFPDIWNHFREHIRLFDPADGKYERLTSSFAEIPLNPHGNPNYIRAAKISYDRKGSPTTVCHIFARMGR